MLSVLGNSLICIAGKGYVMRVEAKIRPICNFLDFAGGITALVLGVLALTNHGGSIIAHLTDVHGGAWIMMTTGLVALYALYMYKKTDTPLQELSSEMGSSNVVIEESEMLIGFQGRDIF
jgi:hypothetical protein